MKKRLFDIILSFFVLLVSFPLILIAWIVASIETKSNGLFTQDRVGLKGRLFRVFKIKTMVEVSSSNSTSISCPNNIRITRSGKFFRNTKIDELPQLWNVFIGDMSFVGPRPDVFGYADKLQDGDKIILSVRPGITGPAQLRYKNEEEMLTAQDDPTKFNNEVIWPDKVRINRMYIENYSFFSDITYIWKTVVGGDAKH